MRAKKGSPPIGRWDGWMERNALASSLRHDMFVMGAYAVDEVNTTNTGIPNNEERADTDQK